jgi:hypothetical protein
MRGEEARPVKPERDDVRLSPIWVAAFLALAFVLLATACAFGVEAFAEFVSGFEKILVRLMR